MGKLLGGIALTGRVGSPRTDLSSSPEFTTNGMPPKCWRRISGTIHLFKGGTSCRQCRPRALHRVPCRIPLKHLLVLSLQVDKQAMNRHIMLYSDL